MYKEREIFYNLLQVCEWNLIQFYSQNVYRNVAE